MIKRSTLLLAFLLPLGAFGSDLNQTNITITVLGTAEAPGLTALYAISPLSNRSPNQNGELYQTSGNGMQIALAPISIPETTAKMTLICHPCGKDSRPLHFPVTNKSVTYRVSAFDTRYSTCQSQSAYCYYQADNLPNRPHLARAMLVMQSSP